MTHSSLDIENAFYEKLIFFNHPLHEKIQFDTPNFVRFPCPHKAKRNSDAAYKAYSDGKPNLIFSCHRCSPETQTFTFNSGKQQIFSTGGTQKSKEDCKRKHAARLELETAKELWDQATSCINHPYFELKKVIVTEADGFRAMDNGTLLLPIRLITGELISVQRVYWDKVDKKFAKRFKASPKNGFHLLGAIESHDTIFFAEGAATSISIREASGAPVICVYGKKFHDIAPIIAKTYPGKSLIYCIDHSNEDEIAKNTTSQDYAKKAIALSGGAYVLPDFSVTELSEEAREEKKLTDFNDLFCELLKGMEREAALAQVQLQLKNTYKEVVMIAGNEGNFSKNEQDNNTKKDEPPKGFELTNAGLFYKKIIKIPNPKEGEPEFKKQNILVSSRIEVVAKQCDLYTFGNTGLTLEFVNMFGNPQKWHMPRAILSDEKAIVTQLCSMGTMIANKKYFIQFLMQSNPEKSLHCVDRIGWHTYKGVKYFARPNAPTIGQGSDKNKIIYQSKETDTPFKIRSTKEEWRDKICKLLAGNSRPIFGVCHGFGAMLIGLTGGKNSGVNFFGPSSIGKTTIAQVVTSQFGEPAYFSTGRTTVNALEERAHARNDCLLIVDELGQMRAEEVGDAIYMLGNGIGKGRSQQGGGLRKDIAFRCHFLVTAEQDVTYYIREADKREQQGHLVRVLDIPAEAGSHGVFDKLPEGFTSGAEFSDYLQEQCELYYGSAYVHFLEEVTKPETLSRLTELIEKAEKLLLDSLPSGKQGQVLRVIGYFARDMVAGELATQFNLTGWEEGEATKASIVCLHAWVKERGGVENQESARLLKQVRAYFETHHAKFRAIPFKDEPFEKDYPAGFKEIKDERWVYYAFSKAFEDMTNGFNQKTAIKHLVEAGFITVKRDSKGHVIASRQKKIDGRLPRFFFFDGPMMWKVEEEKE